MLLEFLLSPFCLYRLLHDPLCSTSVPQVSLQSSYISLIDPSILLGEVAFNRGCKVLHTIEISEPLRQV